MRAETEGRSKGFNQRKPKKGMLLRVASRIKDSQRIMTPRNWQQWGTITTQSGWKRQEQGAAPVRELVAQGQLEAQSQGRPPLCKPQPRAGGQAPRPLCSGSSPRSGFLTLPECAGRQRARSPGSAAMEGSLSERSAERTRLESGFGQKRENNKVHKGSL